jgi:hypothetical protein
LETVPADAIDRLPPGRKSQESFMNDLIFVGIVVVFFVVSGLYVRFCEKL